jgi:hypothetical protein
MDIITLFNWVLTGFFLGVGFFIAGILFLWAMGNILSRSISVYAGDEEIEDYKMKELKENEGYH